MTVTEYQKTLIEEASILGDFQKLSKSDLANGYCDADEAYEQAKLDQNKVEEFKQNRLRSAYHAALMLRYWYKIFEWQKTSTSLNLDFVDFVDWLYDSLWVVFYYRMWRYEYKAEVKHGRFISWKLDESGNRIPNPYYGDPNAPDKIINRCCASMRGRVYQYFNKDKRKTDVQKYSIDQSKEDFGDAAYHNIADIYTPDFQYDGTYSIIQTFVEQDKIVEALIVDGVINYDTFKEQKNNDGTASMEFSKRALVKHLNSLDKNILSEFILTYHADKVKVLDAAKFIENTSNQKLYKIVDKVFLQIKNSKTLLDCLYNN